MEQDYVLQLYIAGQTPNAKRAREAVERLCEQLREQAECLFEVIDVLEHPDMAMSASVIATPTLMRLSPQPPFRVVGNLSDPARVLQGLGGTTVS